jgi:transposase
MDTLRGRGRHRATLHSWAFGQLQAFIGYKARLAGVPVVLVDPRNTSRTCPQCGHCEQANRKSQSRFSCCACGFGGFADTIAAVNLSRRAALNRPNV